MELAERENRTFQM